MRSVIFCLIVNIVLIACVKEQNSPPLSDIGVFPNIADTSSYIRFNGSSSEDLETPVELLQFRWDFNGDGVWETEFKRDPIAIWQYEKTGTSYKTVLIDGIWWMAENLRYGVVINRDSIPSDNAITEMYKPDPSRI